MKVLQLPSTDILSIIVQSDEKEKDIFKFLMAQISIINTYKVFSLYIVIDEVNDFSAKSLAISLKSKLEYLSIYKESIHNQIRNTKSKKQFLTSQFKSKMIHLEIINSALNN
jgi:hypothetical protein